MGYQTDFVGGFRFNKELTQEQVDTINGFANERHEPTVGEDYPGIWCQWVVVDNQLEWDQGEKFYNYVEWLKYLIDKFFIPWGVTISGTVKWFGEENEDMGMIEVLDNKVKVYVADVRFKEE